MVTEPNLDKDTLKSLLQEQFGIAVKNLTFNPKGWASWSYIVETADKNRYFLKIYKNENFDSQNFEFTSKLSSDCGINNIAHPIKAKSGNIVLDFSNFKIVIFNYIEGATSADRKLNDPQLESLGELLAKTHQSKNIIGPYQVQEDFSNPHKKDILNLFNKLESVNPRNDYQKEAKELYLKYKRKFLEELEILDQLESKLANQKLVFVNCHGEPSPDNIMLTPQGEVFLIDWDFPLFAPKEKDLMFFDTRYDQISKGYEKHSNDTSINKDAESFYGHLWNAQEIADFGTSLLLSNLSGKEYEANLKGLKKFLDYSGLGL